MSITSITKWGISVLAAIFFIGTGIKPSFADTTIGGNSWVDSIKFGGDIRLRHDTISQAGGSTDRNRERFRIRFGSEFTIQDITAKLQLASGSGTQVSANQTEGAAFDQKPIWIDMAYVQWKATQNIKLVGGRMPNPFWLTYASDMMWDPDLNPEGYAEKAELPLGDRLSLFANFAQMPSGDFTSGVGADKNPWIFGHQIGMKTTIFEETKITMAITDYAFLNETTNPLGTTPTTSNATTTAAANQGNDLTAGGVLVSPFNILHFSNELAFHAGPLPLSIQGDFITNTQENQHHGRNGYQTGVIAGKAAAKGTWEAAYFYKYLQQNATVAQFADDDFGNGGTNRAGHIFWIGYSPRDYVQLRLKYYITRVLDHTLTSRNQITGAASSFTGFNGDTNHLMLDVLVKF